VGQSGTPARTIRFGVYEVDLASAELRKQGLLLRLQEQPFQFLAALLEQPGEVVTREELCRRLWSNGTNVDFEHGLNAAVTRLRQALSDSAETPKFVETVARRGYRFIAPLNSQPQAERPRRRAWFWPTAAAVAFIAVAALGWLAIRRLTDSASQPMRVVPLTTDPGFETAPSLSPDGNQVAFLWDKGDGQPHIYVKFVGQGDPIQLTTGPGPEFSPAWSPDGRSIAFVRQLEETRMGVFVVSPLGGVPRKVADFPLQFRWLIWTPQLRYLSWMPDSRHVVVSATGRPGEKLGLFLLSLEGGEKKRLTNPDVSLDQQDEDPAVSPDGRAVAFTRGTLTSPTEMYVLTLSAGMQPLGEPRSLKSLKGRSVNPAWSRDGASIVFSSDDGGASRLWRIGTGSSSTPKLFAEAGLDAFFPAVGRRELVYVHSQVDTNIWRQELPSGPGEVAPPVSLISSTELDRNAHYSPDGERIVFQSGRSGSPEIWVCASDGTRCVQMTALNGPENGSPRWSPDGTQIAFDSAAEGNYNVYVMSANGGPPQRLTADPAADIAPTWSRDGKWIYFTSTRTGRREVWKMPSGGGSAIQVTRNGGAIAIESPDGRSLYYAEPYRFSSLLRSNLDGSGEREVVAGVGLPWFDITSDRIYFVRTDKSGKSSLWDMVIATGKESFIASIQRTPSHGLSLSPDGKYLIYSQVDRTGGGLMLLENFH